MPVLPAPVDSVELARAARVEPGDRRHRRRVQREKTAVAERCGVAIRQLEQAAAHDANGTLRAGARVDALPRCVRPSQLRRESAGRRLDVDLDRGRLEPGRVRQRSATLLLSARSTAARSSSIAASSAAGVFGSSTRQPGAGPQLVGLGRCAEPIEHDVPALPDARPSTSCPSRRKISANRSGKVGCGCTSVSPASKNTAAYPEEVTASG